MEILNVGIQGKNMKATATPFLSRMDPVAPHSILSDWNPDQTLVIGIVLDGDNGEGGEIMHLTQRSGYHRGIMRQKRGCGESTSYSLPHRNIYIELRP